MEPCSYCIKTGKDCSYNWLQAQLNTISFPPFKQRRESGTSEQTSSTGQIQATDSIPPFPSMTPATSNTSEQWSDFFDYGHTHVSQQGPLDLVIGNSPPSSFLQDSYQSYSEKANALPLIDVPLDSGLLSSSSLAFVDLGIHTAQSDWSTSDQFQNMEHGDPNDEPSLDDVFNRHLEIQPPPAITETFQTDDLRVLPRNRKRKRKIPGQRSSSIFRPSPMSLSEDIAAATNGGLITRSLMKIYHDSMENALSCWLTERTCPYGITVQTQNGSSAAGMVEEWGPNWSNRIYKRVFKLDGLVAGIRGVALTKRENQMASKALHLAILAFASQWAQASERSRAHFPYNTDGLDKRQQQSPFADHSPIYESPEDSATSTMPDFDRVIQESTWQQARRALQDSAEIESFRVVFAHIIFGLTQKPFHSDARQRLTDGTPQDDWLSVQDSPYSGHYVSKPPSTERAVAKLSTLSELEELTDRDGPPIFLEQGLRHIHTMRSKLERLDIEKQTAASNRMTGWSGYPVKPTLLSPDDSKTVDLLYWLGIMFDTLSAAMHQRPLVVSDEDSDNSGDVLPVDDGRSSSSNGLWGDHFFQTQFELASQATPQRWPCSYNAAARTLNDAAPIKVLLYRKVARLQSLLPRKTRRPESFEEGISDALRVYQYWNKTFNPFFQDCISNHEELPHRIQSWYLCLAGHWYLATLLLADVVESIDNGGWGLASHRLMRDSTGFVSRLRDGNAAAIADLARAACPNDDSASSFSVGSDWHDALSQKALLTEPWTQVLIRAFVKAGSLLVQQAIAFQLDTRCEAIEEAARCLERCRSCVRALWYLGRKSDMALMAAELLSKAVEDAQWTYSNSTADSLDFFALP